MINIKTDSEISLMRESGKITADLLKYLESQIRAGMTTKELDKIAYDFIISNGAIPSFLGYAGFPASICVSIDDMVIHGIPSDDVYIKDGQIVSVDVGVIYNGWHSDAARTFCVGNVSDEKRRLVKVTEECFFKAIEGLRDGTPLGNIGYQVQAHAESNGYGVVKMYTGHGIGKELHESPSVPNVGKKGTGIRVKKGMALAIEPMINIGTYNVKVLSDGWGVVTLDGKPSAHYENTVVITDDGAEIITL